MRVEGAWTLYKRHYDDLGSHERMRLRQWLALRDLQIKEAVPAVQILRAALEFIGVSA